MKQSRKRGQAAAKFLMGFCALSMSFHLKAGAFELPRHIGNLGDSMTAGALADFKRQDFKLPWTEIKLLVKLLQFGATKDIAKVEARQLSWAGGYDKNQNVYSHSHRLSAISGLDHQMPTANVAVSGNESRHMWDQAMRLNEWSENNFDQAYPDYVTLMIGPNDICQDRTQDMVPVRDYHANISQVVDEVLSQSPRSKILLGSVPNIESLRNVAKDKYLHVGLTCEKMWKTIKLCHTLTTEESPNERAKIAQRVIDYNDALQDIADSRSQSYGDRVRLSRAAYGVDFTADDLSVDCFHPNVIGQEKLADVSFSDSWWADEWPRVKERLEAQKAEKERKRCSRRIRSGPRGRFRKPPGC
ncbi:hypothetical protein GW916_05300 [bacterium]|nr:hypothetical protein [bacterium]